MKLEYGKRYVLTNGNITGPLKVNDFQAIEYPFKDLKTGLAFKEDGTANTGWTADKIIGAYYEPKQTDHQVNTVTISREDYDRFVAMEKAFKEVYELVKQSQ